MQKIFRLRNTLALMALLLLLAFPFGPLFPWSPIRPGYQVLRTKRATVLYPSGTELPEPYRHVDEYMDRAERFHNLEMKSPVTVILCRNDFDVHRLIAAPNGWKAGGATYPTGTVIFITPKVAEHGFEPGEFIRHELSHATLNQNQHAWNAARISRQQWFVEGLAVSFGEQKAFFTPEQFVSYAQGNDLGPIIDPEQMASAPKLNIRLGYQVWRYFLEHLIETRGRERFQQYMTSYIADPGQYRELFTQAYGMSLPQAIQQFQAAVRSGWRPNPEFVTQQLDGVAEAGSERTLP